MSEKNEINIAATTGQLMRLCDKACYAQNKINRMTLYRIDLAQRCTFSLLSLVVFK